MYIKWAFGFLRRYAPRKHFLKRKKIEKKKVAMAGGVGRQARRNGINDGFCAVASPEKILAYLS